LIRGADSIGMQVASASDLPGTRKFFSDFQITGGDAKGYLCDQLITNGNLRVFRDPDLHAKMIDKRRPLIKSK